MPAAMALGIIALQAVPVLAATGPSFSAADNASGNWSGYVATNGTYTGAGATWTIPTASPLSGTQSGDATWVGVGGMGTKDLIQTGTIAITQNGATTYQAWYEILPSFSTPIPVSVRPGDSVTASVALQSGTNQWVVSFRDNTTSASYQKTIVYNSTLASAEWIQEMATSTQGSYIPLDNFGTATFTNAWTIKNGQALNVAQSGAVATQMTNTAGQIIAQAASVSSDGTSFSVSRTGNSTTIATAPAQQQTPFVTVTSFPTGTTTTTWTYQIVPSSAQAATVTQYPQQARRSLARRAFGQGGMQVVSWKALLMSR